jgi:AraC family transcriptional regulator
MQCLVRIRLRVTSRVDHDARDRNRIDAASNRRYIRYVAMSSRDADRQHPESFAPITQGACLRVAAAGSLRVTETVVAPGRRLPWHAHEQACLVVLLEGSFTEAFRSRSIVCDGGVALFKPAGALHADYYGQHGARFLVVELPVDQLAHRSPRADGYDHIASVRSPDVLAMATRIRDELDHADTYSPLILEGIILELVGITFREHGLGERSRAPRWLSKTRERLHDGFLSRLTVPQLASEAGVHPDHLSRCFRQHYGTFIGEYVRHLRVRWAADTIAKTALPLSDVARAAGFADQSEFTRRFRELMGTTPGRYRAALRRS